MRLGRTKHHAPTTSREPIFAGLDYLIVTSGEYDHRHTALSASSLRTRGPSLARGPCHFHCAGRLSVVDESGTLTSLGIWHCVNSSKRIGFAHDETLSKSRETLSVGLNTPT